MNFNDTTFRVTMTLESDHYQLDSTKSNFNEFTGFDKKKNK